MDNQDTGAMTPMPIYKCHKKVYALKIAGISLPQNAAGDAELAFEGGGFAPRLMPREWLDKHNPEVGGYLVQYEDGYISYSPAKAFEDGYTLLNGQEKDLKSQDLVYYGPHPCQKCDPFGKLGTMIVKAGNGAPDDLEFDFDHDCNYPNHIWKKHQHIE